MSAVDVAPITAPVQTREAQIEDFLQARAANDVAPEPTEPDGAPARDDEGLKSWLIENPRAARDRAHLQFGVPEGSALRMRRELIRLGLIPSLKNAAAYTDDQRLRVIELIRSGMGDRAIGNAVGLTNQQVSGIARDEGLPSATARAAARGEAANVERVAKAAAHARERAARPASPSRARFLEIFHNNRAEPAAEPVVQTKRLGRPPRPREDEEVDFADAELYHPIVPYVAHVRDFAQEKARAAARATLLAARAAEGTITRIPPTTVLFANKIEQSARRAAEREAEEERSHAIARKARHADYLRQSAIDRRQDAIDRRDRVGEWALDRDRVGAIQGVKEAFRQAIINDYGRNRSAHAVAFGIGEGASRAIVERLIAEGKIPSRSRGPRRKRGNESGAAGANADNEIGATTESGAAMK
ncbi:MAG TPA: hypothetical protein VGP07_11775 [Polyangia bacterium]|jgi:hypothetical protein